MNSLEKLIYEHKPVGIYDFENNNSLIMAELSVYARALQQIEDAADELIAEMFFVSSRSLGFERFCRQFASKYSPEKSRQYISAVMAKAFGYWDKSIWEFEKDETGISLLDFRVNQYVFVPSFESFSLEKKAQTLKLLNKYVPAHLDYSLIPAAKSWNELDGLDSTFSEIESVGLNFSQLKM